MVRKLNNEHVQRQVAERALTKLADGGKYSRRELFDDRRLSYSGKNAPPHWQQRLLHHIRSQGWVQRTGENTGVRYEAIAGQQQALRQLRADAPALCAVLFTVGEVIPIDRGPVRKLTPQVLARALALLQADPSLTRACQVLEQEFGMSVSTNGLRKALARTDQEEAADEVLSTPSASTPPAAPETSESDDDLGDSQKLDTLLRATGAMAQALMALQQRFGALENTLAELRAPVLESAEVLRALK
jgi:hypothetical protein